MRVFRILSRPLDPAGSHPAPAGIDLRLMSQADMLDLCPQSDLDLRAERVARAYARGYFCVAALSGDTVAGYCWFAFNPLPHLDGVWVRFGEDVAWPYKSLVRPQFRGKGIAPALYRFGDAACRERGRTRSVICMETHNAASVSAAARSGYAPSGLAGYLRRPRLLAWSSPAAEQHGIAFFV
jgi:GNAT superfamily N-acetyltransferase